MLVDDDDEVVSYVALTFRIWHEDGAWQGICAELGVPSFGESPGAALDSVVDATIGYLNEIEDHGQRERVFAERGLELQKGEPPRPTEEVAQTMAAGESVSRLDVGLRPASAA